MIDIQNDIRLTKFLTEFQKCDALLSLNPGTAGQEICFLTNVLNNQVNLEEDEAVKRQVDDKVISWMKRAYGNTNLDMKTKSTS